MTFNRPEVDDVFKDWFVEPGAYVLVDGQFGSTGKGLIAGVIAQACAPRITASTTNAGPNSGHTAFFGETKIVTQQVPVASVVARMMGHPHLTLINAGALIDEEQLRKEVEAWLDYRQVFVHPNAAMIDHECRYIDRNTIKNIAGTGKGTGPALARKVMRHPDAVAEQVYAPMLPPGWGHWDNFWDWRGSHVLEGARVFVETAQGFSLGLNSARFYPNVTSRECTVMQAIADARIPAQMVKKVIATYRTFPIRVGNTENSSGNCYPDQKEITFADIGQPEEITTVTKRVRRIFTWSRVQFRESLAANRPDVIFLNFMNYLSHWDQDQRAEFMENVMTDYYGVMGRAPDAVLLGYGPRAMDVTAWDWNYEDL